MGGGADGSFVAFLLTGCDRNPKANARGVLDPAPPPMCAGSGTGSATAAWMIRTDRLHDCPDGSRTLPRGSGRTRGSAEERKDFIENQEWAVAT